MCTQTSGLLSCKYTAGLVYEIYFLLIIPSLLRQQIVLGCGSRVVAAASHITQLCVLMFMYWYAI